MWYRGILAVLAVTYLVCVLWFSGLKKEDMDVNLLTKLRRHSINIDMNNETMQQECSINKLALASQTEKPVYVTTTTTTTSSPTTIDLSNLTNVAPNESAADKDFEPIVKYISDIQKMSRRNYIDGNPEAITSPKIESARTNFEPSFSTRNIPESFVKKAEHVPENDETKLRNILYFWQTLAKSSDKRAQKIVEDTTKGTTRAISPKYKQQMKLLKTVTSTPRYTNPSQNKPALGRWLAGLLSTKTKESVLTSTERNNPNDLGELILPFYKDLIHSYDSTQSIQDIVSGEASRDLFNKFKAKNERLYTFDKKRTGPVFNIGDLTISKERYINPFKFDVLNIENGALRQENQMDTPINQQFDTRKFSPVFNIGDIFKSKERFDNPSKFDTISRKANAENGALRQENQMDTTINQQIEKQLKRNNFSGNEGESKKITKQTIQDIADSVKALILKDLGVINITATPATTNVSLTVLNKTNNATMSNDLKPTSTTIPRNSTGNVYQVMDKILDLYERLKVITDKINVTHSKNKKNTQSKEERNNDLLIGTIQNNMFNRMTNVKHILMNPFRDLTRQEIQKLPSIIQTNSGEIAPLLVPMPNSLKIVNQVVVMSTAKPMKMIDNKSRYNTFMADLSKNRAVTSFEKNKSQKTTIPSLDYKKYSHFGNVDFNRYNRAHKKYDITQDDQFIRTHSYGTHNYATHNIEGRNDKLRHYNKDNNKENEHINYFDMISNSHKSYLEKIPTNGHSGKYHQKLEREDERFDNHNKDFIGQNKDILGQIFGFSNDVYGGNKDVIRLLNSAREYGYDRPIAPRHQQPLNMKNSPYDDTHFRNFLKTQQKVNDMLEKILERKHSMGYSVETT
ncbi:uncharacterized protein LOC128676913 isoform X2 [Plodia interpunctella]|uniref:uncharacterized protein LOC128676913 isoform X2 n=1 Tax=Plodia interpunctella TaxID=58824 RepID=UPI0023687D30|nr:uncharacterized protein LOC128676913 isoform X2 [Plodia interpunctella]